MELYQLEVTMMGLPAIYRVIEISANATFDDLHQAIFHAFERHDPSSYSFFITKKDTRSMHTIWDAPEITHLMNPGQGLPDEAKSRQPANMTRIADAGLKQADVIHYWFDFRNDWWHRILVRSVKKTNARRKIVKLVKSVGESLPQYPDWTDFEEE